MAKLSWNHDWCNTKPSNNNIGNNRGGRDKGRAKVVVIDHNINNGRHFHLKTTTISLSTMGCIMENMGHSTVSVPNNTKLEELVSFSPLA